MGPVTKELVVEAFRIRSILEAAMNVIARKGVEGANMQEIAEVAGISKGTIYLYFQNQQELLERTADFIFTRLKEKVFAAFESEGSFAERLRTLLRIQFEFFREHKDFLRAYGALKADTARCARLTKPQYQAYVQRFSKFLGEGMRNGELRDVDPQRHAVFLTEAISAVLFQRTEEQNPPAIEQEVDWLASMILEGISRKGSKK
jgi:AcrR family transcriptional regulator